MKRVILMRHGNAENTFKESDFNRNLSGYGIKEVKRNIVKLISLAIVPDVVTVSTAYRTMQTFAIFEDLFKYDGKSILDKSLYDFHNTSEFIHKYIEQINDDNDTVMFIGHNPTLSNLLQMLTNKMDVMMDTSSIFVIDFEVKRWQDIDVRTGSIYFSTH